MPIANPYFIGFKTLLFKEVHRIIRIWPQSILPAIITTLLYFLIFGHLMGSRIGPIEGVKYIEYIAPGLIMMQVITNAYANVSSSVFLAKFTKSIEALLISPIPNWLLLLGYITGGVTRGIAVAIAVAIMALIFTSLQVQHFFLMFVAIFFSAVVFSLAGFINALYAKKFDDISFIPTFVLTPLTYLGGVFYSVNLLPTPWQVISFANPILYFVNLFRFGMLGLSDINITLAFSILMLLVILLFWIALRLLQRGVGFKT